MGSCEWERWGGEVDFAELDPRAQGNNIAAVLCATLVGYANDGYEGLDRTVFADIMKQVSYNPLMEIMLAYEGSESLAFAIKERGAKSCPDENYARKIMQRYSIGLWQLHRNTTKYLDENQEPVLSYNNCDITNFARACTGFQCRSYQSNIESVNHFLRRENYLDAMEIPMNDHRDYFPKIGFNGKYIGDGIMRCDAKPQKAFLKTGARYHYLGRDKSPELAHVNPPEWDQENINEHILNASFSNLYKVLCNANDNNACRLESTVVLTINIDCYGTCEAGILGPSGNDTESSCECSIHEPCVVPLDTNSPHPIYYEYNPMPCIQIAFPKDGYIRTVSTIGKNIEVMCANTRLIVAMTSYCYKIKGMINCVLCEERVIYNTAKARCNAKGLKLCTKWDEVWANPYCSTKVPPKKNNIASGLKFAWSGNPCTIKAPIDVDGNVAIVHEINSTGKKGIVHPVKKRVALSSGTFFGVFWDSHNWPVASSNYNDVASCKVYESSCVCNTSVETVAVFDGLYLPILEELRQRLHIGAPNPSTFDDGTYSVCTSSICQGLNSQHVIEHMKNTEQRNEAVPFNESAIFEIAGMDSKLTFLSNSFSTVIIGSNYSIPNLPSFNRPVDTTLRDALYKKDVVLNSYVTHSNTALFIATRSIQLLVMSNLSPQYVNDVANDFHTGTYLFHDNDIASFGNGQYGNMDATVTAVLLNQEARSPTLDTDATFGSACEPLIKMMHFFRAMELRTANDSLRELNLIHLDSKLGQEVYSAPSVFSSFLPEYQLVGPVMDKGLVSPEFMILDAPIVINYVNALVSLPYYGLTYYSGGEGLGTSFENYELPDNPGEGKFDCNQATDYNPSTKETLFRLRWVLSSWGGDTNMIATTTADVIAEMDLLLTGGHLNVINRGIIEAAYDKTILNGGANPDVGALRYAQQLFVMTPEFHITNHLIENVTQAVRRKIITPDIKLTDPPSVTDYKAIVYVFLSGVMDSYSALLPYSDCSVLDLVQQYQKVRGDVAIDKSILLPINSWKRQPCDTFGLHLSLTHLHQLYDSGEASFIANMGPLLQPITKYEYEAKTKSVPAALFAHNSQQAITHTVNAQDASANGVLGCIYDVINFQEGKDIFKAYSISATLKVLEGTAGIRRLAYVLKKNDAYEEASVYERSIVLLPDYLLDIFHVAAKDGVSRTWEWAYHDSGGTNVNRKRKTRIDGVFPIARPVNSTDVASEDSSLNLPSDASHNYLSSVTSYAGTSAWKLIFNYTHTVPYSEFSNKSAGKYTYAASPLVEEEEEISWVETEGNMKLMIQLSYDVTRVEGASTRMLFTLDPPALNKPRVSTFILKPLCHSLQKTFHAALKETETWNYGLEVQIETNEIRYFFGAIGGAMPVMVCLMKYQLLDYMPSNSTAQEKVYIAIMVFLASITSCAMPVWLFILARVLNKLSNITIPESVDGLYNFLFNELTILIIFAHVRGISLVSGTGFKSLWTYTGEKQLSQALVVPTRSSKSTISWFFLRFYDPVAEQVCTNEAPLETLNVHWWWRQVGHVEQEPFILPRKVFICIPNIMLLDEATRELDTDFEQSTQETLAKISNLKQITTVTVAHQFSAIVNSDKISVTSEGGVHDFSIQVEGVSENIKAKGSYAIMNTIKDEEIEAALETATCTLLEIEQDEKAGNVEKLKEQTEKMATEMEEELTSLTRPRIALITVCAVTMLREEIDRVVMSSLDKSDSVIGGSNMSLEGYSEIISSAVFIVVSTMYILPTGTTLLSTVNDFVISSPLEKSVTPVEIMSQMNSFRTKFHRFTSYMCTGYPNGGEQSKLRRMSYTHDDWKKHQSQYCFFLCVATILKVGAYKNLRCSPHFPITNNSYQPWNKAQKIYVMSINHTQELPLAGPYYDSRSAFQELCVDDLFVNSMTTNHQFGVLDVHIWSQDVKFSHWSINCRDRTCTCYNNRKESLYFTFNVFEFFVWTGMLQYLQKRQLANVMRPDTFNGGSFDELVIVHNDSHDIDGVLLVALFNCDGTMKVVKINTIIKIVTSGWSSKSMRNAKSSMIIQNNDSNRSICSSYNLYGTMCFMYEYCWYICYGIQEYYLTPSSTSRGDITGKVMNRDYKIEREMYGDFGASIAIIGLDREVQSIITLAVTRQISEVIKVSATTTK